MRTGQKHRLNLHNASFSLCGISPNIPAASVSLCGISPVTKGSVEPSSCTSAAIGWSDLCSSSFNVSCSSTSLLSSMSSWANGSNSTDDTSYGQLIDSSKVWASTIGSCGFEAFSRCDLNCKMVSKKDHFKSVFKDIFIVYLF